MTDLLRRALATIYRYIFNHLAHAVIPDPDEIADLVDEP